jgi:hypothetical protein
LQSYFYTSIAGLDTASNSTSSGWQHVLFRPTHAAVRRLGHAAAAIETPLGVASVSWRLKSKTRLTINATVPEGATGELSVPLLGVSSELVNISEGGVDVWSGGKVAAAGRSRGIIAGRVTLRGQNVAVTFTLTPGSRSFTGDVAVAVVGS